MEIASIGDGIHCLLNQMSMQNNLAFYMNNMVSLLDENQYFRYGQEYIILDNCSIYKETINYFNAKSGNIYFLSPCGPQLDSMDKAFNHIKAHLKHKNRDILLKLNAEKHLGLEIVN